MTEAALPPAVKLMYKYEKATAQKRNTFSKFIRFSSACCLIIVAPVVISYAITVMSDSVNLSDLKQFDDLISPIVMQDPPEFNEHSPLPQDIIAKSAVWDTAIEKNKSGGTFNKDQKLIISMDEIQKSCKKLFGKSADFSDQNALKSNFFEFDSANNQFLVDAVSGVDNYAPLTLNARSIGNEIVLQVGYFLPSDQFDNNMNKLYQPKIEKTKTYKLKRNKIYPHGFYVCEISD